MNPKDMFVDLPADEREELAHLVGISEGLQPGDPFIKRTEMQLKDAFAAKKEKTMKRFNLLWQVFAGTAAVVLLTLGTIWLVRIALPMTPNPAMPVNSSFVCPVTKPNGSLPPGETNDSPYYLGNGQLWTSLWPDGKVIMNERDNRQPDGSFSMKWGWVRGVNGPLTIEGHRLDGPVGPLQADIPDGYGDTGFQVSALIFPTTGCWEVTGRVGDASLTFVTEVVMEDSPFPTPPSTALPSAATTPPPCDTIGYQVQANDTLASIAANNSISVDELKSYNGLNTDTVNTGQSLVIPVCGQYDWHGTTVYRVAAFPKAPAEMSIYTHADDAPATIETARALGDRFGIQGEIYLAPGPAGSNGFLVTDGKQRLLVSSERSFSYQAGYDATSQGTPISVEAASPLIDAFLKAHGFDFAYKLAAMVGAGSDWFHVIPLTPDGHPTRFDYSQADGMQIQIDPQGKVISLTASILNVAAQPVGQYGVISAEEAWQKFLQDIPLGVVQSGGSGPGAGRLLWLRTYPDGQPMTLAGSVTHFASAEAGKPPFISIDSYQAVGETAGLENIEPNVFIEAQGQFSHENGIQKFKVDSWQVSKAGPQYFIGSLRSEGGKAIFESQGAAYTLSDVPADVPVPVKEIDVTGLVNGSKLEWQSIIYIKDGVRGGGGGGGGEFAKLNLSGAPVPWPTFAPVPTPESIVGKRVDDQRGLLMVNIIQKTDGSQRTEYTFITPGGYYYLQGPQVDQLQVYHNRPVKIWGVVSSYNQHRAPVLSVERYEVPFPDLKFQILRGKQKITTLDGQPVVLFTAEDGKSYVQLVPTGLPPIEEPQGSLIGKEGDPVQLEVLAVPDETFGGYPTARIFSAGLVDNPKNGATMPAQIMADKPNIIPETVQTSDTTPTLTIDTIELVYYTVNPGYSTSNPEAATPYIQPVWRFYGHYGDGSYMEILVQALKQEFLLPEAAPAVQGG